jgi:hypothetical protein
VKVSKRPEKFRSDASKAFDRKPRSPFGRNGGQNGEEGQKSFNRFDRGGSSEVPEKGKYREKRFSSTGRSFDYEDKKKAFSFDGGSKPSFGGKRDFNEPRKYEKKEWKDGNGSERRNSFGGAPKREFGEKKSWKDGRESSPSIDRGRRSSFDGPNPLKRDFGEKKEWKEKKEWRNKASLSDASDSAIQVEQTKWVNPLFDETTSFEEGSTKPTWKGKRDFNEPRRFETRQWSKKQVSFIY